MSILMRKRKKAQTTQASVTHPLYLVGLKSNAGDTEASAVGKQNETMQTPIEENSEGSSYDSYEYYEEETKHDGEW